MTKIKLVLTVPADITIHSYTRLLKLRFKKNSNRTLAFSKFKFNKYSVFNYSKQSTFDMITLKIKENFSYKETPENVFMF